VAARGTLHGFSALGAIHEDDELPGHRGLPVHRGVGSRRRRRVTRDAWRRSECKQKKTGGAERSKHAGCEIFMTDSSGGASA